MTVNSSVDTTMTQLVPGSTVSIRSAGSNAYLTVRNGNPLMIARDAASDEARFVIVSTATSIGQGTVFNLRTLDGRYLYFGGGGSSGGLQCELVGELSDDLGFQLYFNDFVPTDGGGRGSLFVGPGGRGGRINTFGDYDPSLNGMLYSPWANYPLNSRWLGQATWNPHEFEIRIVETDLRPCDVIAVSTNGLFVDVSNGTVGLTASSSNADSAKFLVVAASNTPAVDSGAVFMLRANTGQYLYFAGGGASGGLECKLIDDPAKDLGALFYFSSLKASGNSFTGQLCVGPGGRGGVVRVHSADGTLYSPWANYPLNWDDPEVAFQVSLVEPDANATLGVQQADNTTAARKHRESSYFWCFGPLAVRLTDSDGNPMSNRMVRWEFAGLGFEFQTDGQPGPCNPWVWADQVTLTNAEGIAGLVYHWEPGQTYSVVAENPQGVGGPITVTARYGSTSVPFNLTAT